MTGAPMPDGADAIVMVERTVADGDCVVRRGRAARSSTCVPAAATCSRATSCSNRGTVLSPAHLGVLASLEIATVEWCRAARVGVISTGDELVETGPLAPGQIRDSNRPMLLALSQRPAATRSTSGPCATTKPSSRAAIERRPTRATRC